MTKEGKEKLTVGVVTALITGVLAVAVALLTKPPVTNIVLPGGQTVNAGEIVALQSENSALQSENAALRAAQTNATKAQTTTHELTSTESTTTQAISIRMGLSSGIMAVNVRSF